MLEAIKEYLSYGWQVFPCNGKLPATKTGYKDATGDYGKASQMFSNGHSVAVATGKVSGIFVLDVDIKKEAGGDGTLSDLERQFGKLPSTVEVTTPSKGRHLYFKYVDGVGCRIGFRPGLDIRGDGGYVIAPPSKDYYWEISSHPGEVPIADAPNWLIEMINERPKKSFDLPKIVEPGTQDSTMFKFACSLKAQGFDADMIRGAISVKLKDCPQDPHRPFTDKDIERWVHGAMKYPDVHEQSNRTVIKDNTPDCEKVERTCEILNKHSKFFRDLIGRVIYVDKFSNAIRTVTASMMITEISRFIMYSVISGKSLREKKCTVLFATQVLESEFLNLRTLKSITNVPRFMATGALMDSEGYNAIDQSFYVKTFTIPDISFEESKSIIDEFLYDFAFSNPDKDLTNILSLLFAPPLSNIITNYPLHAVSANQARTGKSLLVESIMLVYSQVGTLDWSNNEDELKKKVTAMLLTGPMFICFDNVKSKIQNSAIEGCLTSGQFIDRVLGRSEMVRIPSKAIWIATGNNLEFGTEMMRRSVCSELNAHIPSPELRTGFKHPDIKLWVQENRERLLGAVYSLIRAWIKGGMPKSKIVLGGFERYALYMGGLLQYLGYLGFMDSPDDSITDIEHDQEIRFLSAWAERKIEVQQGNDYAQASDLLQIAVDCDFNFGPRRDDSSKAQYLGYRLKKMSKKFFDGFTVTRVPNTKYGTRYFINSNLVANDRPY